MWDKFLELFKPKPGVVQIVKVYYEHDTQEEGHGRLHIGEEAQD